MDTSTDYQNNKEFYDAYASYLTEERVRRVHDSVLDAVCLNPAFKRVIDLGCGKGNEFYYYARPDFYLGIDQNAKTINDSNRVTAVMNYRNAGAVEKLIKQYQVTGAVSLFSIEITRPQAANHIYYENLFRHTDIDALFLGGFYYEHAKGEETVVEAGGLVSYQTPGQINSPETSVFHETRIEIPCPSELFGEDIVEVYRLLQRPESFDPVSSRALLNLVPDGYRGSRRPASSVS